MVALRELTGRRREWDRLTAEDAQGRRHQRRIVRRQRGTGTVPESELGHGSSIEAHDVANHARRPAGREKLRNEAVARLIGADGVDHGSPAEATSLASASAGPDCTTERCVPR